MDDAGCGNYRVIQPFNQAMRHNLIEGWCRFGTFNPVEIARIAPDTLYVQRHVLSQHQTALSDYRRHFPDAKIVFEVDDLMAAVPEKSVHRQNIPTNVGDLLAQAVQYCDRLVVTTEPLREAYAGLIPDIRVVPNSIDLEIWGKLEPRRRDGHKPRVGWAGGSSHTGDLEILIPVVEALKDEVEWVFFGMFPGGCREMIAEYHGGVPIADYPAKLAGLDLDLALVPLELNDFNACKSNLRLLEYGILGYPVIATDFTPYQCGLPVTLVDNQPQSWINAIRDHLADRLALAARGDALREAVKSDWSLEKILPQWRSAWFDF
jgi:glycosyltransferase involved in cell wall biosynthesis